MTPGDGLALPVEVTAVLAKRTAASSCCGAKLRPAGVPRAFECVSCGQPCDRVLSDPEEVTAHG